MGLYEEYKEMYGDRVGYLDEDCITLDNNKLITGKGILELDENEHVEDYSSRWVLTADNLCKYKRAINIDTEDIQEIHWGVLGIADRSFLIVDRTEPWKIYLVDKQFKGLYAGITNAVYESIRGYTDGDKEIYACVINDGLGYLDVEYNMETGKVTVTEGYDA